MAVYPNVVNDYKERILNSVRFDDVIDELIAEDIIDEKQYLDIWSRSNHFQEVLAFILKDAYRCKVFIDILETLSGISETVNAIRDDIESIRRVITAGEFPAFPLNYVVRNSVADVVKSQVLKLEFGLGNILVIHGAPGFGKSYLVNQVLQTKTFVEFSGEAMFWINLAEYQNITNIIYALWKLYLNIAKLTDRNNVLQHCPEDVGLLVAELRKLLQDEKLKNAILVLDDVKSSHILDMFKISSKIIVTTQDKDVADASSAIFIPITTGFTQKESLELLGKSLETNIQFVKEAEDIHKSCSGCPMLVNIIGSILKDSKEEALASSDLWNEILNEISETYSLKDPTTEKVMCMIQKCVDRLSEEIKKYFLSLAVFGQHVNIKTVILMKLWNLSNTSVRNIMKSLEHKSLVVSFFNVDLKSYVYSLHSLVFTYLVNHQSASGNIKAYHMKLIALYDDITNQTPFNDPISQYILGYYGFHAKHAELYEKFDEFLKLEFIERKIKFVGSADLLTDYTIYHDLITKNDTIFEEKLEELKKITSAYSCHLHISPETNIIQYVMLYSDNNSISDVYSEAHDIAISNNDRLYFKLHDYSGKRKIFSILKMKNEVTAVTFMNGKKVLIGTETGDIEIKVFDQYEQKVHRFEGHTNTILNIILSPDGEQFLSISNDQTAKLWKIDQDLDPQSPKCKQFDWKNLHSPIDDTNYKNVTFKMEDADFILSAAFPHDNTNEIVTGSYKGKLIRWDTKYGSKIKEMPERGIHIPHVLYTHDSQEIMFCCNGKIFRYLRREFQYTGQIGNLDQYNTLHLTPNSYSSDKVVAISEKYFEIWNYAKKIKTSSRVVDSNIITTTINNNFLVLGTEGYKIYLFNLNNESWQQLENDFGLPNTIFLVPENYIAFIHVHDRKTLHRCEVSLQPIETPIVQNVLLFTSCWKDRLPIYAIVKNESQIDIYNGSVKKLSEISVEATLLPITFMTFCPFGSHLLLGTSTGSIYFYNSETRKEFTMKVFENEEIIDIKCFDRVEEGSTTTNQDLIQSHIVVVVCKKELFVCGTKERITLMQNYQNCYFYLNFLIIIEDGGKITLSNINSFHHETYEWSRNNTVMLSAFNNTRALLALSYCHDEFSYVIKVLKLYLVETPTIKTFPKVEFDVAPTSLCFSFDGQLVAVGRIDGVIEVLYVEADIQEIKKRAILNLHKSVEKILFAPYGDPILVSLGDQVAWWNLATFQNSCREKCEEMVDLKYKVHQLSLLNIDWKNKKVHEKVPYLLNSTNLNGRMLKYISASRDFKYFLIVDNHGSIFKMDLIS